MVSSQIQMKTNRSTLLAIVVLMMAQPALSWGAEQATQEAAQAPPQQATSDNPRFDGYIFLDADGKPLPFQSDEEIAEFLRSRVLHFFQDPDMALEVANG